MHKGTERHSSLRGKNWELWECDPKNRSLTKGRVFPCGLPDAQLTRARMCLYSLLLRRIQLFNRVVKRDFPVELFSQLIQGVFLAANTWPVSFLAVGQKPLRGHRQTESWFYP